MQPNMDNFSSFSIVRFHIHQKAFLFTSHRSSNRYFQYNLASVSFLFFFFFFSFKACNKSTTNGEVDVTLHDSSHLSCLH